MATITIPKNTEKYVDNDNNDKNKFVDDQTGKYLSIFGEKKWYYTQVTVTIPGSTTSSNVTASQSS